MGFIYQSLLLISLWDPVAYQRPQRDVILSVAYVAADHLLWEFKLFALLPSSSAAKGSNLLMVPVRGK